MDILIWFAIFVIIVVVVYWLLQQLPLPQPANQIIHIAIVLVVAIVVIGFLLQFQGGGSIQVPRLVR